MSELCLIVLEGAERGTRVAVEPGQAYVTGRGRNAHLRLRDEYCSTEHARLECEAGHWTLTDLGSHNGTFVNDFRIQSAIVAPGDRIRFGRTLVVFSDESETVEPDIDDEEDDADSELWLRQAREGDEQAVKRLITKYHPRLRARISTRMDPRLRSLLEPEDVLQQAYTEAFVRVKQFDQRGPGTFYQWLLTIAENKLADEHRAFHAKKRDIRREARDAGDPHASNYDELLNRVGGDDPTPSQIVRKDEAKGLLLACMARLPDHYRQVLQLRYIEERPVNEVAEIMQRGEGAVTMLCQRAMRQLRRAMNEAFTD